MSAREDVASALDELLSQEKIFLTAKHLNSLADAAIAAHLASPEAATRIRELEAQVEQAERERKGMADEIFDLRKRLNVGPDDAGPSLEDKLTRAEKVIEFAGYMADAFRAYSRAKITEEPWSDAHIDAFRALRSTTYEYRKRARAFLATREADAQTELHLTRDEQVSMEQALRASGKIVAVTPPSDDWLTVDDGKPDPLEVEVVEMRDAEERN